MINDFSFSGYRSNPVKSTGLSWLANYDNTITAALHLSVLCIAIVWSFFNAKNKVVSVFYYVAFFILLLAIVLTFARTAWVAVFTGLLIFFIYELKRNRLKALSLYSVLFFLGTAYMVFFSSSDVNRGLTYRDQIWIGLLNNIDSIKGWVFGVGPAASVSFVEMTDGTIAVHAHNIYVEIIYRNGILGVVLFLLLFLLSVRSLIMLRESRDKVFFLAVLCGASTSMFFDFSNLIYSPNLIWLWVWFPIAISLSARRVR